MFTQTKTTNRTTRDTGIFGTSQTSRSGWSVAGNMDDFPGTGIGRERGIEIGIENEIGIGIVNGTVGIRPQTAARGTAAVYTEVEVDPSAGDLRGPNHPRTQHAITE